MPALSPMLSNKEKLDVSQYNMDVVKHPSKSILKDNTMPLLHDKRRVSFAPEVTLHKIDFLPSSSKRRKTIGFSPAEDIESFQDNSASVLEQMSDSSDNDYEDFDKFQENADQIISGMNSLNRNDGANTNVLEENDVEEEVTMELTGQINMINNGQFNGNISGVALTNKAKESVTNGNVESNIDDSARTNNDTNANSYPNVIEHQSSSEEDNDDDEANMEITEGPKLNSRTIFGYEPASVDCGNKPDSEGHVENGDDSEVTMNITTVFNKGFDGENIEEDEQTMEQTMDLTNISKFNLQQNISIHNPDAKDKRAIETTVTNTYSATENNLGDQQSQNDSNKIEEESEVYHKDNEDTPFSDKYMELTAIPLKQIRDNIILKDNQTFKSSNSQNSYLLKTEKAENNDDNNNVNNISKGYDEEKTVSETQLTNIQEPAPQELGPKDPEPQESDSQEHESQEMELTQNLQPAIIENVQESPEMELTQNLQPTVIENVQSEGYESQEMELTQSNKPAVIENVQSQEMELTQVAVEEDKKSDIENTSAESLIVNRELVTTTVIPLADVNGDFSRNIYDEHENDDGYIPVSLNDFLNDVGIKFYDDLDIGIDSINRLSISLTKESFDFKLVDYIRAISKLQLLALYEFSCEELNKNIQEGKNVFSEFNKTIENNNPQLFKDYYLSDESERFNMNMKLQLIKDYTRHQSKKTWYDWRTQLTNNLIIELEDKYLELRNDKEILMSNIRILDEHILTLKDIHENLTLKFKNILKIYKHLNSISPDELKTLKNDLVDAKVKLTSTKNENNLKQQELDNINSQIVKTSVLKSHLVETLSIKEQKLSNTKKYELNDIKILNFKFKLLQDLLLLRYAKSNGKVFDFKFDKSIDFQIDFSDINDITNIRYTIDNDLIHSSSFFHKELVPAFLVNTKMFISGGNAIDHFKSFKYHWDILKRFDLDIFKISLKFPIIKLELANDGQIKFDIKYFNSENNLKVLIRCELNFKSLSKYPEQLSITAEIKSGNLSEDMIKRSLVSDTVPNGLLTALSMEKLTFIKE